MAYSHLDFFNISKNNTHTVPEYKLNNTESFKNLI